MPDAHLRLRRITQTIADLAGKPWSELRILDLGSLEGLFAIECAVHGAQVLGIEGRETNNAKARETARSMGLSNVEFITDDVRNVSRQRFGAFDVVICSGILYHLPGEDGCRFIHSIAEACTRLTIVDTHVGLGPAVSVRYDGRIYHGSLYKEHEEGESGETKLTRAWASLDNSSSLWFTKPSLLNLLRDAGFSSVYEILRPRSFADYSDRLSFAAIKGELQKSTMSPELQETAEADWPEVSDLKPFLAQPIDTRPRWRQIASGIKHRIKQYLRRLHPAPREVWIDVGAHLGEGTLDAALADSGLLVFVFEPNWSLARQIMGKAANFVVLPMAVSDTDGIAKFFINAEDGSHSLCPMTEAGREQWKEFDLTVKAEVLVPTMRLDTFLGLAGLSSISFLKVDAEGFDLKVIQSAGERLKDIRKIQCEVDVTPNRIYQGSASRDEMISFLQGKGFALSAEESQNEGRQQNLTFAQIR